MQVEQHGGSSVHRREFDASHILVETLYKFPIWQRSENLGQAAGGAAIVGGSLSANEVTIIQDEIFNAVAIDIASSQKTLLKLHFFVAVLNGHIYL